MPSKEEKQRRRKIVQQVSAQEQTREEAALPLSKAPLRALLNDLDESLVSCNHTFVRTQAFLTERHLPQDEIIDWLWEQGGYCDCEVLANVGEIWSDRVEDD